MLSCSRFKILKQFRTSNRLSYVQPFISYSTEVYSGNPDSTKKVTFADKIKETWHGPNFKYWFIGTTGFLSWMIYYGLKTYKKTRVNIDIMPGLPTHSKVERIDEINELLEKHKSQSGIFGGQKVKKLSVYGAPATGKTTLIYDFVKHLQIKQNGFQYSIPKSNVSVFLQCDCEDSFLISLKSIAAKLELKPSDLQEHLETAETPFSTLPFETQCNALLSCIQGTLKKHPGWIMVFDNVQATSPPSISKIIDDWFLIGDESTLWSSGTIIKVHEGAVGNLKLKNEMKYAMNRGLSMKDGCQLIKEIANLETAVAFSTQTQQLLEKVYLNPLGIVCVGILLREKLNEKEMVSIERAVKEIIADINANLKDVLAGNQHLAEFTSTSSGSMLVAIETVIAMVVKCLLNKDPYLYHGFDIIATLKPSTALPSSLLARHLKSQFYRLPPLAISSGGLTEMFNKQKNDLEAVKSKVDEFEPKGKAWSNKNLAEYMRKIEEFFMTGVTTVKEIYNMFYGELPPLPEKQDGLDMFRACELLIANNLEPGGTKAVSMHPLIYNAVRQHFLSTTVHDMESDHLLESQIHYYNQPWYKKFSGFSEQACLQKLRLKAGHSTPLLGIPENIEAEPYLFRYNFGINISPVLSTSHFPDKKEDFWFPRSADKLRYLQSHMGRVVASLCEEILVTKEDVQGRSVKRNLLLHLEYILNNQPREVIGTSVYIEGLQTVATCYMELYKDYEKSKQVLEDMLKLQRDTASTHSLDIGKTLSKIGEIHNMYGENEKAKLLLEEAAELYENDRRKYGEYKRSLEFGKLLGLLGVVYSSLSLKVQCKETIERSLMLKQATPPDLADEAKSKQFGSEFASSLTDLGHSYTSLGMPLYGKKILDLALSAHKNLHGDNHPEVVRTLTILAVSHLMQGHNEESKKLRNEAGKLQAALNKLPMY